MNEIGIDTKRFEGRTPGKYSTSDGIIRDSSGRCIAEVRGSGRVEYSEAEKAANARLFADAPSLLAEVKELRIELEATKLHMANRNDALGMEIVALRKYNIVLREKLEARKFILHAKTNLEPEGIDGLGRLREVGRSSRKADHEPHCAGREVQDGAG